MVLRLHRGTVPLHHQLYTELRRQLDDGSWQAGDRLPTERELATRYGCSLITVRRALDELRRERRIDRMPGRGTFVTVPPIERDLAALTSFTEEMRERALAPETRLLDAGSVEAESRVADALGLSLGAPTFFLERLRYAGGEPLLLEKVHLPAGRLPGLLEADLQNGSLYELLAERYGLRPVRGREVIQPTLPTAREARLLQQSPRRPALAIELSAFSADDTPIEYCRTVVRGDRARYSIEVRGPKLDLGTHVRNESERKEPKR